MSANQVDPHIFVIFGATGNLTRTKLFPALYQLSTKEALKKKNVILGVSRKDLSDESFKNQTQSMLKDSGITVKEGDYSRWCTECLHYQTIGQGGVEDYIKLADRIKEIERENTLPGNRIFYMALPPTAFPPTITGLGKAGLNHSPGWTRLVIEKPFGRDFVSVRARFESIKKDILFIEEYLGRDLGPSLETENLHEKETRIILDSILNGENPRTHILEAAKARKGLG